MDTREPKGTSSDGELKVSYFLLSPSLAKSLPFTSIMDMLAHPLFIENSKATESSGGFSGNWKK